MVQDRSGFHKKWPVLLLVGFIPFCGPAFGRSVDKKKDSAQTTPVYSDVNALDTAPVTVYPKVGDYSLVTWDTLSHFECDTPDMDEQLDPRSRKKKKKKPIPDFITALNHKKLAVVGFMLPMDMDDKNENTTGFIMSRTQSACCYGIMPKMNEWIFVTMRPGTSSEVWMDIPLTVFGTFEVGEKDDKENGCSLYRMTGEKMGYPDKSLW